MIGQHTDFTLLTMSTFGAKYCVLMYKSQKVHWNGDNHIQNFHLGRYDSGKSCFKAPLTCSCKTFVCLF